MSAFKTDEKGIVTVCPACGQKNRTPYERLGETGNCGRCKAALPPPAVPIEIETADHFDRLLRAAPVPIVVDFWAPWCGPCKVVAPELEKVAAGAGGKFVIVKVNTEALPALGQRFNVRSIPTMAVFRGGGEVTRTAGARPAPAIRAFVDGAIGA